jgi:beta-glucosidase
MIAANPRTVVVINAGAAMTMPWSGKAGDRRDVAARRRRGGGAGGVLTGKVNPSGKLPVPSRPAPRTMRST